MDFLFCVLCPQNAKAFWRSTRTPPEILLGFASHCYAVRLRSGWHGRVDFLFCVILSGENISVRCFRNRTFQNLQQFFDFEKTKRRSVLRIYETAFATPPEILPSLALGSPAGFGSASLHSRWHGRVYFLFCVLFAQKKCLMYPMTKGWNNKRTEISLCSFRLKKKGFRGVCEILFWSPYDLS